MITRPRTFRHTLSRRLLCELMAVAALAALVRTGLLVAVHTDLLAGEAVIAMGSINVLEKGHCPMFLPGECYAGGAAILGYVGAALFRLFGVSSFAMCLGPSLFSIGIIAAWQYLLATFYGRRLSLFAGLLLAVSPTFGLYSVHVYGMVVAVFLSLLAAIVFFFLWHDGHRNLALPCLLGLGLGCACWAYDIALFYCLILGVLAFATARRRLPGVRLWLCVLCFGIGFGPVLRNEVSSGFPHLRLLLTGEGRSIHAAIGSNVSASLHSAPVKVIPRFFTPSYMVFPQHASPIGWTYTVLLYVSLAFVVWDRRVSIARLVRGCLPFGKRERISPAAAKHVLMPMGVVGYVVFYGLSPFSWESPRHLIPLYPFVSTLIAMALLRMGRRASRVALVVVVLLGLGTNGALVVAGRDVEDELTGPAGPDDIGMLAAFLNKEGIRYVYCNLIIKWRLMFESQGTIVASCRYSRPTENWYPEYHELAFRDTAINGQRYALVQWNTPRHGGVPHPPVRHRVAEIGSLRVYCDMPAEFVIQLEVGKICRSARSCLQAGDLERAQKAVQAALSLSPSSEAAKALQEELTERLRSDTLRRQDAGVAGF